MSPAGVQAWRGTAVAVGINVLGTPLDVVVGHALPGFPAWASFTSSAVGALLFAVLLATRGSATQRLCDAVFVLNAVAIAAALWTTSWAYAVHVGHGAPFQANKLGALTAAVLAPGTWSGVLSIGIFLGTAAVRYVTFPAGLRGHLASDELPVLAIYGLFAVVLHLYRRRSLVWKEQALQAHIAERAARSVAHEVLAIRDLANTPIQTLRLDVALLRASAPASAPQLDRMDRAIDRLGGINELVRAYERSVEWTTDAESFDASPDGGERPAG